MWHTECYIVNKKQQIICKCDTRNVTLKIKKLQIVCKCDTWNVNCESKDANQILMWVLVRNTILLPQLLRYVNAWDHLILGIEIVFFCFIFYYIIEEILEIVHTGWEMIWPTKIFSFLLFQFNSFFPHSFQFHWLIVFWDCPMPLFSILIHYFKPVFDCQCFIIIFNFKLSY